MPAKTPPPGDDVDDLFNYDVEDEDVFRHFEPKLADPPTRKEAAAAQPAGLGIDAEVKIRKQRTPVAKLDEARLLSQAGIPKLRTVIRTRMKSKGKGHEFRDIARLLNLYQLWLDDLYPRAKFSDGLAMIEKLGHSKRMQRMRRAWIDEGKPRDWDANEGRGGEREKEKENSGAAREREARPVGGQGRDVGVEERSKAGPMPEKVGGEQEGEGLFFSDDEGQGAMPDADELDGLLAEEEAGTSGGGERQPGGSKPVGVVDEFAAEMEAMQGMNDMW